ncbi:hypothetical protein EPN87_00130 [archaeon]|nr:MAG: hypothetical protein EPN87_00130 [archaeon]
MIEFRKPKNRGWRNARNEMALNEHITELGLSFRKHISEFVTGAFAVVAALVWKDAIQESIMSIKYVLPNTSPWVLNYIMAILVTIISVVGIVVVNKVLKSGKG